MLSRNEKNVYLYLESNMPKDGWFQSCYSCGSITRHTILMYSMNVKTRYFLCNVFTCPKCKKKYRKDVDRYDSYREYCLRKIYDSISKNNELFS